MIINVMKSLTPNISNYNIQQGSQKDFPIQGSQNHNKEEVLSNLKVVTIPPGIPFPFLKPPDLYLV